MKPTDKSKNVFNSRDKNYQQIIKSQNYCCNQEMSYPAEWPFGKQQRTDRWTDLQDEKQQGK